MRCPDGVGIIEIGDRARDLQDAVIGARAELEFVHRLAEQFFVGVVERTMRLQFA